MGNGGNGQNNTARMDNYGRVGDKIPPFAPALGFSRSSTFKEVEEETNGKAAVLANIFFYDKWMLYILRAANAASFTFGIVFALISLQIESTGATYTTHFWVFYGFIAFAWLVIIAILIVHATRFGRLRERAKHMIEDKIINQMKFRTETANQRMRNTEPTEATHGLMQLLKIQTENHLQHRAIWLIPLIMRMVLLRVTKTANYLGCYIPILVTIVVIAYLMGARGGPEDDFFNVLRIYAGSIVDGMTWLWLFGLVVLGTAGSILANIVFGLIWRRIQKVFDLDHYKFTDLKESLEKIFEDELQGASSEPAQLNDGYRFYPYSFDVTKFIALQHFKVCVKLYRQENLVVARN